MRAIVIIGLASLLWVVASTAGADDVRGTRFGEEMTERAHRVRITLHPSHATMRVRRTVHNGGDRHDEATFRIRTPDGGVATGLRTLGELDGKPRWFKGELLEREVAAARYRELTGVGMHIPMDPALLYWVGLGRLGLQVFPVAPESEKTIEYSLVLPVRYSGGRYLLTLPQIPRGAALPEVEVVAGARRAQLLWQGTELPPGARARPMASQTELALRLKQQEPFRARLAVASAHDRFVVHYENQAAARLSELPRAAHVIVLIDVSASRGEASIAASVAAARSYLGHFVPRGLGARVQVLLFDREVHPQHSSFVPAEQAFAQLAGLKPSMRNGTFLVDALAEAARRMGAAPRGAPRRMLLITDMQLPSRDRLKRAQQLVADSGALLHVARVSAGYPSMARVPHHDWAPLARTSGGLLWDAEASEDPHEAAEQHVVFEHWARPVRLESIRLDGVALPPAFAFVPDSLEEGEEIRVQGLSMHAPAEVTLHGELWARPVVLRSRPSAADGRRLSALVFGTELTHDLGDVEMRALATRAGAVSPVTSYLAVEPGVRPSTEGLVREGYGRVAGGFAARVAKVRAPTATPPNPAEWLSQRLQSRWELCGGRRRDGSVEVETTRRELADILHLGGAQASPRVLACMRTETWALQLPEFFRAKLARYRVVL